MSGLPSWAHVVLDSQDLVLSPLEEHDLDEIAKQTLHTILVAYPSYRPDTSRWPECYRAAQRAYDYALAMILARRELLAKSRGAVEVVVAQAPKQESKRSA